MAVRTQESSQKRIPGVRYISKEEGAVRLDRAARKWLGMSGDEFVRRFKAGDIPDPDRTEVIRLSILMQYAED
jgi:hypothetical protein